MATQLKLENNMELDHKYYLRKHWSGDWKVCFKNNIGATLDTYTEEQLISCIEKGVFKVTKW